ncbi:biotin synthase [Grosmannia clavigera kw1407]|uniref:biotin synthase n=1 Tax=Grosmannia clavigera (strain kw1407 / UAMH 11150) TaxID=655863 RepID=F0XD28_GROCL|nr:biotin synthase [Grosmannia clavigera kw1407]EFX04774.1 biotin synthase [Grosmannia clavigera kw1407]
MVLLARAVPWPVTLRVTGIRAYAAIGGEEQKWTKSTIPTPTSATTGLPAGQVQEKSDALLQAMAATEMRNDWTREEISAIYHEPLMELVYQAGTVHRRFHRPGEVQLCTLMNIKTGGCTEDCKYCAQSTRHQKGTGLVAKKVESVESVLAAARVAKENGSARFCMGAAWRDMRGRKNSMRNVIEMIQGVRALGMEACVTLGMIDQAQALELKAAGLTAYNHNVDTSREFYPSVISTRTYDERLQTLGHVRSAGINVCSGGILGLGEADHDRVGLLHTVATLPSHPESFPVNALVPIKGTPLAEQHAVPFTNMLRTIATARLLMPRTIIRIAAGRKAMSEERQMLCFSAGANAIFTGEKMLTTECNGYDEDKDMFARWGLQPMKSTPLVGREGPP